MMACTHHHVAFAIAIAAAAIYKGRVFYNAGADWNSPAISAISTLPATAAQVTSPTLPNGFLSLNPSVSILSGGKTAVGDP